MKIKCANGLRPGYHALVTAEEHPEMMGLEFGVLVLEAGQTEKYNLPQEVLYDLLRGKGEFSWDGICRTADRKDCFHEGANLLHVPERTEVTVRCLSERAEITISRVENHRKFEAKFFAPEDCLEPNEQRGAGTLNECATRINRTFFTRETRPESNLYGGEVVSYPGRWSSYPAHRHLEPEIYFYKFLPEDGYGLAEYGEDAYKVRNNDLMCMPAYVTHSQTTAPGYAEFYQYMIRLQDDKDFSKETVKELEWTIQPGAKFFPEL